ncbi:MAG: hypothetical protein ACI4K9_05765 [Candidatus Fimenecus sp.]
MQKKTKIILGIVAAVVAIVLFLPPVGFGIDLLKSAIRDSKPANYYADAWNLAFPESAKKTYTRSTGGRDWWRYSIYTIDPGDDAAFADCLDAPFDEETLGRITKHLDEVQVPQDQRPDLERTYRWKRVTENGRLIAEDPHDLYGDSMYVLYDKQNNTVYTLIRHR